MSAPTRRKRPAGRALAEFVNKAIDPLVAKQGFGESSLLLRWEEIVGARVAGFCEPIKLQWPPRAKNRSPDKAPDPATLVLRVEPGFGLDAQHMAPALLERINNHLGWRCVAKVAIRQERIERAAPKKPRRAPTDAAAKARAEAAVAGMEDDALRAALTRLGENALARR